MSSGPFKINCLPFEICNTNDTSSDDEYEDYKITIKQQNMSLLQEIKKYKKMISRLQNENEIAKQREIIFKDLLATNKRKFDEEVGKIKLQFKQTESVNKIQHKNQLNALNEQLKSKDNKIKQLEQTIDEIQKHFYIKISNYNNDIKSLNNEIRNQNMKINQLEKDNKDFIVMCKHDTKEITELKHQIYIKNAEIHSLQMLTPVKSYAYDIDIVTPCNYQRKRSSGIRKMSILSDANGINVPLYVKQRSNNGSISISSPSTESPFSVSDNIDSNGFIGIDECIECKVNQRDERSQTC
eukprot:380111_1